MLALQVVLLLIGVVNLGACLLVLRVAWWSRKLPAGEVLPSIFSPQPEKRKPVAKSEEDLWREEQKRQ